MMVITTYAVSAHVCRGQVPTRGVYTANYNRAGKTIVSTINFSPAYYRRKEYGVNSLSPEQALTLPQVTQWSDVIWIGWTSAPSTQTEVGDLKYIFKHHVVTPTTLDIMQQSCNNVQHNIDDEWPGYTFMPETEEYLALLGTAHGM